MKWFSSQQLVGLFGSKFQYLIFNLRFGWEIPCLY